MKIAVIVPDRNDRPEFLENCIRMIMRQTLQPTRMCVVNDKPLNERCDISFRYRKGYNQISNAALFKVDLIAFMENDDWYADDYLEYMVNEWEKAGRPDLIGTDSTIYYHLKLKAYFTMHHHDRSSAMNTFIKPGLKFPWCADSEPYTDIHLWLNAGLNGVVIRPNQILSIGMKHGQGLCGGFCHTNDLERFVNPDNGFLKATLDDESFNFYSNLKL